jgi:hypothetical protein
MHNEIREELELANEDRQPVYGALLARYRFVAEIALAVAILVIGA